MKNTIYFFLLLCGIANAQTNTLVQVWTNESGSQSGNFKNFTLTNNQGKVFVAGARKNNSTTHDGYISQLTNNGQVAWTYNYVGTGNGDDAVLSAKFDNKGNIYLTGTTYKSVGNNYDLFIVKLKKDGSIIWSDTYNGNASSLDTGGDIALDTLGNVYVVGATMNTSSLVDFVILKYDSTGTQSWENQFDYGGFNDAANKVTFLNDSLYVSGVSQSAPNNWDFTTITVSTNDGTITNEIRSGGSGNGIDKLNAITYDATGHIYITGGVINSSSTYDARTIKLNPNLTIAWSKDYNGTSNLDDESNDVKVDSIGNVYIAGYTTITGQSKNILLIKYNSVGDTIFTKIKNGIGNGNDQANAVCLGLDGSIFITGSSKNTYDDIITVKFNPSGLPIKTQTYSGTGNGKGSSISITDLGEIIISGEIFKNGQHTNSTIQYLENIELPDANNYQILDNGKNLKYVDKLLMVRMHPACFNMEVMDNKKIFGQSFGVLVKDTIVEIMSNKLYGNTSQQNIKKIADMPCLKPFYFLDSNDTLSISRSAALVKVPKFWATLTYYLPADLKLSDVQDSLDKLFPIVQFYDVVAIPDFYSNTNDVYYHPKQKSLYFDSIHPLADINVEEAWDIETGKDFIRVGINDTHADTLHAEYDLEVHYNICLPDNNATGQWEHGTAVTGIIGAKRNNQTGIAGIAGGNGSDSAGVKLYNLNILEPFAVEPSLDFAVGIVLGSTQLVDPTAIWDQIPQYDFYFASSDTGLGLHVMNHSYGLNYGTFVPGNPDQTYDGVCYICQEAIEYSYRNGVINVASRGNEIPDNINDWATDSIFPSCVKDEMVISVTASGYDGLFKSYSNDNPDPISVENYMSMYGRHPDVMAPGTSANVYTTAVQTNDMNLNSADNYTPFNGTSASAPHVTGTVALMLSHVNQPCPCEKNLSPEDVEYIIQKTASERDSTIVNGNYIATPGYDNYNGWGMLDAGKALKAIQEPKNQIIHVNQQNANITTTLVAQDAVVHLVNPYTVINNTYSGPFSSIFDLAALFVNANVAVQSDINQPFVVDIYKVSTTIDHSSKTNHLNPTSAVIKDYWIRNSRSIGWELDSCIHINGNLVCDTLDVSQNVYFDTAGVNMNTASLYTYVYNFKHIYNEWDSITYINNKWYPGLPASTEFAYSIYVYDSLATSVPIYSCDSLTNVKKLSNIPNDNILIYPNPTKDILNIVAEINSNENIVIVIFDISGRKVETINKGNLTKGKHYFKIDTSTLSQGVYFINVSAPNKLIANKKFIKTSTP